jgi:hypothetical protein
LRFDAFTSGFYSFPSLDAASQLTMNYYSDLVEGAEKGRKVLTPTPGLALFATLAYGPVRGMAAGGNGLLVVGGSTLYSISTPGTVTPFTGASIAAASTPVQIIKNIFEALIASNGSVYVTTGATTIAQCQFSTQLYGLVIEPSTGAFPGALTGDTGGIFDWSDIGATVVITGGPGFTAGTYTIHTVNSDGSASLATGSWGTAGSTMGLGYEWLLTGGTSPSNTGATPDYISGWQIAYLDGTYFASQIASNRVYYSQGLAEGNQGGVVWDPLNFFTKETRPDSVNAMIADHEQLYLFGTQEGTEIWSDTGNGTNPFQRNQSYCMHCGCYATFSVCRLGAGVAWIGGDIARGLRVAWLATGYVPQRISTAAVEKAWGAYSRIDDAVAYTCIMDGHEFWVITFPDADATWVYDATLGEWHQRGWWGGLAATTIAASIVAGSRTVTPASMAGVAQGGRLTVANADGSNSESVLVSGVGMATFAATFALSKTGPGITVTGGGWHRQRGWVHVSTGIGTPAEVHYVGDWFSAAIYMMSSACATDATQPIHRQRRAPHLSNENKRRFYSLFELDCDTGKADVEGAAPRVRWQRLGQGRDRIFQVDDDGAGNLTLSYSDDRCLSFTTRVAIAVASGPASIGIVAAYLEWAEGTG